MEFSKPEYWSGYFPSPGDLPNPGIEPRSLELQVDSLPAEPQGSHYCHIVTCNSHISFVFVLCAVTFLFSFLILLIWSSFFYESG